MHSLPCVVLCTFILSLARLAASAPAYYIAPNGSDTSGNGSQARPWATITHADRALTVDVGGTTVYVAPGTYRWGNVTTRASGRAGGRLTWQSTTPWGAKLVATQWGSQGHAVDIVGFDFDGRGGLDHGIAVYGSGTRILQNRLQHICNHYCCSSGAITGGSYVAQGNTVQYIGPPVGVPVPSKFQGTVTHCNQMHGIYVSRPGARIQQNVLSNLSGYGIHAHGVNCHSTITQNTITGAYLGGILLGRSYGASSPGCAVDDYNTIAQNRVMQSGAGIRLYNRVGSHNSVQSNTFSGLRGPTIVQPAHGPPVSGQGPGAGQSPPPGPEPPPGGTVQGQAIPSGAGVPSVRAPAPV